MKEFLATLNLNAFGSTVGAVIVLVIGAIAMKVIVTIVKKGLSKSSIDSALHKFITNVVRIIGWIFIIVAVLSELGVYTTTFVAVLTAASAAIALALKDSLSNVAGGIIILITKPFGQGDYVEIAGAEGNIQHIDILNTTMLTADKKTVTIPNGTISSSVVTNFSKQGVRRVDCTFQVGYDSDLGQVKEILKQVAESCPMVMKDQAITAGVASHDESGVSVALMACATPEDYWATFYYLQEEAKVALEKAEIDIPYPHMEVRLHNKAE